MTPLLNPHSISVLLLILVALILFAQERIRLETSSLLILIALILGFQLYPLELESGQTFNPAEFFMGFGHEALLTICALMMLGRGIEISGALKPLTSVMAKYWGQYPTLSLAMTLIIGALLSGFLNNTPIVVMLLPVLIGVALSNNKAPSKILIPVGLATLIGGTATTIGTSTNLLIVAVADDLGVHSFTMFDFALPVILVGSIGILYLIFIAPLLLPSREVPLQNNESRIYKASLMVSEDSLLNDKMLSEVLQSTDYKMGVSRIVRGENQLIKLPTITLKNGDNLIISGTAVELLDYSQKFKADLFSLNDQTHPISKDNPLDEDDQVLAEILVTEGSFLANKTLKESSFSRIHELVVLALHRMNKPQYIDSSVSDVELHRGDILLVQGHKDNLQRLKENTRLLVLDNTIHLPSSNRAPIAIFIMIAVIAIAALQIMPISVSALTGVGAMLITRCLNWREMSHALNPSIIMIIVVSLALGKAMQITSADQFLGHQFIEIMYGSPPVVILGALIFLMSLLTNVVSNTAAAVIGTPVAINIAQELGAPPEAFILAVLFGVNMSYATPIGYQTNLLIFSAGGYKFSDFLKVGLPLTLIMGLGFTAFLALYYQL
ncbi:SLC13 family permease [Thalassotalea litorea]|uniref:SLC13 family permease n=1 Tax=Thalassotalea litorea TaxID=2020715 RepID=A0A5R9IS82_9GAMM|nr:SLC13 family permease [Thalassotalea litorea]TLU67353.1 SLC13 family permease [Thalassotalea litorea]